MSKGFRPQIRKILHAYGESYMAQKLLVSRDASLDTLDRWPVAQIIEAIKALPSMQRVKASPTALRGEIWAEAQNAKIDEIINELKASENKVEG